MSKPVMSLVAVALALVFSSAAFAESPTAPVSVSDEAFLASLQAPEAPAAEVLELPALEGASMPDLKSTVCGRYSCRPCTGGVKTCWECLDGTKGCTGCGSVCMI